MDGALPPATPRYDALTIVLHWLLAAAVIGLLVMGLWMTQLPFSPARLRLFNWHKWAGIIVLVFMGLRLGWRCMCAAPELPAMPRWQAVAARVAHLLLYALVLATAVAGWAYSTAAGFPVVVFGILPLPDLAAPSEASAAVLKQVHHLLAYGLGALVACHILAVAKHQWIDGDNLMARMGGAPTPTLFRKKP